MHLLANSFLLQLYQRYIEKHRLILEKLEQSFKRNKTFEQIYRDFETRKVCYLPLNTFLLRPLQRILHYQLIVECTKLQTANKIKDINCSVSFRLAETLRTQPYRLQRLPSGQDANGTCRRQHHTQHPRHRKCAFSVSSSLLKS